jgi:hypothetical protein
MIANVADCWTRIAKAIDRHVANGTREPPPDFPHET